MKHVIDRGLEKLSIAQTIGVGDRYGPFNVC